MEKLFSLLPTLEAARRTYCSHLEGSKSLESKRNDALPHRPTALPQGQASRHLCFEGTGNIRSPDDLYPSYNGNHLARWIERFNLAGEMLEELDKTINNEEEPGYSLKLLQERERPEGVHLLCTSRKGMAARVLREIHQKQADLRRKLCEFHSLLYRTNFLRSLTILAEFL